MVLLDSERKIEKKILCFTASSLSGSIEHIHSKSDEEDSNEKCCLKYINITFPSSFIMCSVRLIIFDTGVSLSRLDAWLLTDQIRIRY